MWPFKQKINQTTFSEFFLNFIKGMRIVNIVVDHDHGDDHEKIHELCIPDIYINKIMTSPPIQIKWEDEKYSLLIYDSFFVFSPKGKGKLRTYIVIEGTKHDMYTFDGQFKLDLDMVNLRTRLEGSAEDKRQLLLLMVMFYDQKIERLGALIKQNMGASDVISTPMIINCRSVFV